MFPTAIDFRITSECNMRCPFCFGTKEKRHMDTSAHIAFLRKLREKGVKNIVLTGGEPTCFPGFSDLLHSIRSMGYRITLSTNGSFWSNNKIRDAVLDCVSFISLPIESADCTVHNLLRPGIPNHFEMVHQILQDISCSEIGIQIKISTVVTNTNIGSVSGILDNLPLEPDIWKLYQLSSCAYNRKYYNSQHITDEQFKECVDQLQKKYIARSTKIVCAYEFDRDRKYLFLEHDGSLKTIIGNQETLIGHTSEQEDILYPRIVQMVDSHKINTNFISSFT